HRLLDADGKRVARLRIPGIARVPVPGDGEVDDLLLAATERPGRQRGAHVLASLEHLRQADIGVVRPAHDAGRLMRYVVDARLLGVHVGAVEDCNARHAGPPAWIKVYGREARACLFVCEALRHRALGALPSAESGFIESPR